MYHRPHLQCQGSRCPLPPPPTPPPTPQISSSPSLTSLLLLLLPSICVLSYINTHMYNNVCVCIVVPSLRSSFPLRSSLLRFLPPFRFLSSFPSIRSLPFFPSLASGASSRKYWVGTLVSGMFPSFLPSLMSFLLSPSSLPSFIGIFASFFHLLPSFAFLPSPSFIDVLLSSLHLFSILH